MLAKRHIPQSVAWYARSNSGLIACRRQNATADLPVPGQQIRAVVHPGVQVDMVDVVKPQSRRDGETWRDLPFVLDIGAPGADVEVVPVRVEPCPRIAGRPTEQRRCQRRA